MLLSFSNHFLHHLHCRNNSAFGTLPRSPSNERRDTGDGKKPDIVVSTNLSAEKGCYFRTMTPDLWLLTVHSETLMKNLHP